MTAGLSCVMTYNIFGIGPLRKALTPGKMNKGNIQTSAPPSRRPGPIFVTDGTD